MATAGTVTDFERKPFALANSAPVAIVNVELTEPPILGLFAGDGAHRTSTGALPADEASSNTLPLPLVETPAVARGARAAAALVVLAVFGAPSCAT